MTIIRAACDMGNAALQCQRGHLLTWAPVFLGIGISLYFVLPLEPGRAAYLAAAGAAALGCGFARWFYTGAGPLFAAVAAVAIGFGLAGWRAHGIAAPVLEFRYYGAIEGRVVGIDRSSSDKIRITLAEVALEDTPPWRTPARVRVSLHGQEGLPIPEPGSHAMVTGHLSPPPSPTEPHGFDFERHAWFGALGAVGYARNPALTFAPPQGGLGERMFRLRMDLSAAVQARMPGDAGAVAAAVTTGDRSGMSQDILTDLRRTNLAHLLAISGLHMGLLTGFVFSLTRGALALCPPVALRWPTKKIAAITALCAGAIYLALSGGAVATERAFIMAAVVFGAVLCNRRALTLRAVAIAALIVLFLRPEALLGPGFQMSFAATTALVVVFRTLSDRDMFGMPRWIRPVASLLIASSVAGLATAPFGAAHFNIFSHYGLIANLLSVPIMGAVVMPAAVIAALAAPLGLAGLPLWAMEQGLNWILGVARWVSALEGAVSHIPAPGPVVLPLIALGGIFIALWQGRGRLLGAVPMICAAALWIGGERPALLISPTGGLVGLMQENGRVLSKPRGDGFVASTWLENDGDAAAQDAAYARGEGAAILFQGRPVIHATGKRAREAQCAGPALLVLGDEPDADLACEVITPSTLRETGSMAFVAAGAGYTRITARDVTGRRLWNDPALRARTQ